MRAIRMLRSMWRGLETESRLGLYGHERGNPGHRQGHDLTDHRASPRPYQPDGLGFELPMGGERYRSGDERVEEKAWSTKIGDDHARSCTGARQSSPGSARCPA